MSQEMEQDHGRDLVPQPRSAMVETIARREAAEVQAAMMIARGYPRDEMASQQRILTACRRPSLAEEATYEYARGGQTITGPSIRLAEVLAMNWGNMQTGVKEVERRDGESTVMAYCWDLETNTRDEKTFTIRHWRDTKGGGYKIKDERDIYEMIANAGARRKRSCILAVIPCDVQEAAVSECGKTLAGQNKAPIGDRIVNMLDVFRTDFGVSQEMIEKKLGHKADVITEHEMVRLKRIYQGLRDGMTTREAQFDLAPQRDDEAGKKAAETIHGKPEEKPAPPVDPNYEPDGRAEDLAGMLREATTKARANTVFAMVTGEAAKLGPVRTAALEKIHREVVAELKK